MAQYMLLVYEEEVDEAAQAEREQITPLLMELNAGLREAGLLVGVQRLRSTESATSVRIRDGQTEIIDGPFAVTKEVLAGYYVLECADLDEALKAAARMPMARWGTIEVRPIMPAGSGWSTARRAGVELADEDVSRPGVSDPRRGRVPPGAGDRPGHLDPAGRRLPAGRGRGAGRVRGRGEGVAARRRPGQARRVDHDRGAAAGDRSPAPQPVGRRSCRAGGRADARSRARRSRGAIVDDRLRLIFTCCHPALEMPARVALTLRTLGGLTTGEIARAFLVAEPTMGKRIVRAKRKIAEAHIPYRVPEDDELPERLRGVLQVVYLIFNEGYAAAEGDRLVREELCDEAIRLGELLTRLMPDDPEVWGLSALMLLHDARRAARVDASGRYVALDAQDRSRWDQDRIRVGLAKLERALAMRRPGEYQLQAAISAVQIQAPDDWARIAELYGALAALNPSPVVELNRAVAVGMAVRARRRAGTARAAARRAALERYQPLYAAHAELLSRAGDAEGAARAYERAIALSANDVEREELERRRATLR